MNRKLGPGEPPAGPWQVRPIRNFVRLVFDADPNRHGRPWILAVDGRSGSGKSTIATLLRRSHLIWTKALIPHQACERLFVLRTPNGNVLIYLRH